MKIWKVEVKPGHFSANALALLIVTLGALLLADYGYEASSMLRLAVVAVVTTIFSVLAFRYSQQDIPGLVVSWAAIICAMVVLLVGWAAYTYEVPFPVDAAVSYIIGPLSLIIFYIIFLYASFFVYHNFIEEEKEAEPAATAPFVSRAAQAARAARMRGRAESGPIEEGPVSRPAEAAGRPAKASARRPARRKAAKAPAGTLGAGAARKAYARKTSAKRKAPAKRKAADRRASAPSKSKKPGRKAPAKKRGSRK